MTQAALAVVALFFLWFGSAGWRQSHDELSGTAIGIGCVAALAALVV
jgi:hypothetical protein